jgi:hypothetical protein
MGEYEYVLLFHIRCLLDSSFVSPMRHVEWICPRCGYFNPSPKSRRSSSVAETSIPSTPTTGTTALAAGGTDGEVRQRKGKKSSGLKHELEAEVGDKSSDRMDVDEEPVGAEGEEHGTERDT